MTLGAGSDARQIESAVRSMGLPELSIKTSEVKKHGFRALSVQIDHPPEHAHRHLHHITDMIDRASEIEPAAKQLAKQIFGEVAIAEAKVHGSTLEKVHFHEVGAIDSIADIVGTAVAMVSLGIEVVEASPVPTGTGSITIAHGKVSIPAPATAEILKGVPIAASDVDAELTTPTGAAILKAQARRFGSLPAMTIDAIGIGAGTKDLPSQANVLRVLIGSVIADSTASLQTDQIVLMEANIDDCTAEQLAAASERLMAAGALDVFQTPCLMKKGRSGILFSVLAPPNLARELEQLLFATTSTIGVRYQTIDRHKLARQDSSVETEYGKISGKTVTLPCGDLRFKPDHDEVERVASEKSISAIEVRRSVEAAKVSSKASATQR
jgi:uncharacterized protein (TIGR00299 family) protein